MGGVAAYAGPHNPAEQLYMLLVGLQHRGQEAAGVALVTGGGSMASFRGDGMVSEALPLDEMVRFCTSEQALCGIGHVKYSVSRRASNRNGPQPLLVGGEEYTISVALDGSIINYKQLAREFRISYVHDEVQAFAEALYRLSVELGRDVVEALRAISRHVIGAYSVAVLTPEPRLIIARDPKGFRPLAYGYDERGFFAASETAPLEVLDVAWREVEPGGIVSFDGKSLETSRASSSEPATPCIFEYVYISRPDSVFNGVRVYRARLNMGRELARRSPAEADVVLPVPDSGRIAALGYSRESGLPVDEGLIINKYLGRGFITPAQNRDLVSRLKYGFVRDAIEGKRVVLVDDSIVRGTTMRSIVSRLRNAGAKEVHIRIASPPFSYPCFMGVDIASKDELIIWRGLNEEGVAKLLGADSVRYNTVESLRRATGLQSACFACFTCMYPFRGLRLDDLEEMARG